MKLYLSGPMTGIPEFNYPEFRKYAKNLRDLGFDVFDPSECFDGLTNLPKSVYMRKDIEAVLQADKVLVLQDWEKSSGARLEVEVANECGIPVQSVDIFLKDPTNTEPLTIKIQNKDTIYRHIEKEVHYKVLKEIENYVDNLGISYISDPLTADLVYTLSSLLENTEVCNKTQKLYEDTGLF